VFRFICVDAACRERERECVQRKEREREREREGIARVSAAARVRPLLNIFLAPRGNGTVFLLYTDLAWCIPIIAIKQKAKILQQQHKKVSCALSLLDRCGPVVLGDGASHLILPQGVLGYRSGGSRRDGLISSRKNRFELENAQNSKCMGEGLLDRHLIFCIYSLKASQRVPHLKPWHQQFAGNPLPKRSGDCGFDPRRVQILNYWGTNVACI
jgi:hypothetical protein